MEEFERISKNIAKAIKEADITYEELSRRTGIARSALHRYATGQTDKLPIDRVIKIAIAVGKSPAFIMGWTDDDSNNIKADNIYPLEKKSFPLLGEIACGEPIMAAEKFELYVKAGTDVQADFCLRCKGDSMVGARINDGDIVFIRKQPMVENGEIAAVIIDDEATLKRVYYDEANSKIVLQAENSHYAPLVYVAEELNQIRILGKAVAFQSDVK